MIANVGTTTAAIGVFVGTQLPRGIITDPVSITTFKIKVPFDHWVTDFDSKEAAKMHKENQIRPLFRGVSIDNPKQVVVIHQSMPGSVEKILSDKKKNRSYWSYYENYRNQQLVLPIRN